MRYRHILLPPTALYSFMLENKVFFVVKKVVATLKIFYFYYGLLLQYFLPGTLQKNHCYGIFVVWREASVLVMSPLCSNITLDW